MTKWRPIGRIAIYYQDDKMFIVIKSEFAWPIGSGERKSYFGPFITLEYAEDYVKELARQLAMSEWDISIVSLDIPLTKTGGTADGALEIVDGKPALFV